MKLKNGWIVGISVLLMIMLLISHRIYANGTPSIIIMVALRLGLATVAVFSHKRYREQYLMTLALCLSVVSDLFLVFLEQLIAYRMIYDIIGIVGFIGTYLVLNAALLKNFRIRILDFIVALPFGVVYGMIARTLMPFVAGTMLMVALLLGLLLCFTATNMVATVYRGYFNRKKAIVIALAGVMIFTCDMFVAIGMFHPDFQHFILWVENTTWIIYTGEWLILVLIIRDEKLLDDRISRL